MIKIAIATFIITVGQFTLFGLSNETKSNRIAVIVNKDLKQEIEENLNIYLQDLKNEGYQPILKIWDTEANPTPQSLKAYLKGLYLNEKSLQGTVFIGYLPIPVAKDPHILRLESVISNKYIAEGYYRDLIGKEWININDDYKFDQLPPDIITNPNDFHNAETSTEKAPKPEIWTSRIEVSALTSLFNNSEGELVNAYLEKNHAYRTGEVVFPKQNLLYSLPQNMLIHEKFAINAFHEFRKILSMNYTLKEYQPITVDTFFTALENNAYEILGWQRHGWKFSINLGAARLTSNLLSKIDINIATAFVLPISCWIGNYEEPGYFAGSYVFNKRFFAMAMLASTLVTRPSSMLSIIDKLQKGSSLGMAFYQFLNTTEKMSSQDMAIYNARFIVGDGTLKLQPNTLVANKNNSPQKYVHEKYPYPIAQDFLDTYMHTYAESGGTAYLERLTNMGADIAPALLSAVLTNNDTVNFFIEKGADIEAIDGQGNTPLLIAISKSTNEIIQLLIKNNANIEAKNQKGETALIRAASIGNDKIVQLLIENGADIETTDNNGNTPLLKATSNGKNETVQLLIEKNANINAKNNEGNTALHIAALAKNFERDTATATFLIASGADIKATNNLSQTPSDIGKKMLDEQNAGGWGITDEAYYIMTLLKKAEGPK